LIFLLDVNVLIALLDGEHDFHEEAHAWFGDHASSGWATCAITENAVLRILGQRRYLNTPGPPAVVAEMLDELVGLGRHTYWDGDVRLLDSKLIDRSLLTRSDQITDLHLLALAVSHKGKFATFDRRIVPTPVVGGVEAFHFIPRAH
jgi:toxin-antitoxin system PIN domain toxin